MGDHRAKSRAELDASLRDMMRDAASLPVPEHLLAFAAGLEQDGGDASDPSQRWEGRGA